MADNQIKNIAIIGAGGNIGSATLSHLLAANRFDITLISRSTSTTLFPSHPSISLKKGSYTDPTFLSSAFSGNEALIIALNFMAMGDQKVIIEAAARAGVKWILPTEYAGDGLNEGMVEGVPLFWPKRDARKQIEGLAKEGEECEGVKWVGVATNPWIEASIQRGLYGFSLSSRTATLYSDAGQFNSSTLNQAGLAITRLLSLPISNPSDTRASLSHYANNFLYVSSLLTSQIDLFSSIQRATNTTGADWTIENSTIEDWITKSREAMKGGNMMAGATLTYAYYMGEGKGGDYESKAREDREVLRLEEEELDAIVRRAVEEGVKRDNLLKGLEGK